MTPLGYASELHALPCRNKNIDTAQVAPTATEQELKKAYKMGALKYHPGRSRRWHGNSGILWADNPA